MIENDFLFRAVYLLVLWYLAWMVQQCSSSSITLIQYKYSSTLCCCTIALELYKPERYALQGTIHAGDKKRPTRCLRWCSLAPTPSTTVDPGTNAEATVARVTATVARSPMFAMCVVDDR